MDIPQTTLKKLKRAQELLAQKKQKHVDVSESLDLVLEEFLTRHDPIEKAKRAAAKPTKPFNEQVYKRKPGRQPLNAKAKHELALRDQNRCTHTAANGSRCHSERWLQTHHVKHVTHGGTNELENLRTLCFAHHQTVHLRTKQEDKGI